MVTSGLPSHPADLYLLIIFLHAKEILYTQHISGQVHFSILQVKSALKGGRGWRKEEDEAEWVTGVRGKRRDETKSYIIYDF